MGRLLTSVLVCAVLLALAGCGGGGGDVAMPDTGRSPLRTVKGDDPRVMRASEILEQADTILIPGAHVSGTGTVEGRRESFAVFEPVSCSPTDCVTSDGTTMDLDNPLDDLTDVPGLDVEVKVGSRGGFDVGELSVTGELVEDFVPDAPGLDLTLADTEGTAYGLWGEYGWAGVMLMGIQMAGGAEGESFDIMFEMAVALAAGSASGSNPAGLGRATWKGVAEAVDTSTFERRQGRAVVTIPELSEPLVGVDIDVPGYTIGSPGWDAMPLRNGHFASGTRGDTYLEGNFHGPDHSEVYGVFDTGVYTGAFGARRQ